MNDELRSIELEIEVPGTPEEVWRAIATGPGITSWYVPHTVEEREGGSAKARFGAGPEMEVDGRVAAWEPPNRVVFDGGEDAEGGLAFEWLVEARDGGTCIVRLVNSGFGGGGEWDDHFDAMTEGWRIFMSNLVLHLTHFSGQSATASLPTGNWMISGDQSWNTLCESLGVPKQPDLGERIEASAAGVPSLAGVVIEVHPSRITLLLDSPAPGTAFIAAESMGDQTQVSIWSYLYGPEADAITERDEPQWQSLLDEAVGESGAQTS